MQEPVDHLKLEFRVRAENITSDANTTKNNQWLKYTCTHMHVYKHMDMKSLKIGANHTYFGSKYYLRHPLIIGIPQKITRAK